MVEEIQEAIKSLQSGKSPGPDGFPVEFYKKFPKELSSVLTDMYHTCLSNGLLPTTLRQASVSYQKKTKIHHVSFLLTHFFAFCQL
ncbi:hypothetical protein LDENG_00239880 [Lucifuga dentata]|nr:hypothetical protein LDENG_00239880 [Lucifuga dentata]